MLKRLLHVGPARIANRISLGDKYDLSVEYLLNSQPNVTEFVITRLPADTLAVHPVVGEESMENERKEDASTDRVTAGASEARRNKPKPGKHA